MGYSVSTKHKPSGNGQIEHFIPGVPYGSVPVVQLCELSTECAHYASTLIGVLTWRYRCAYSRRSLSWYACGARRKYNRFTCTESAGNLYQVFQMGPWWESLWWVHLRMDFAIKHWLFL